MEISFFRSTRSPYYIFAPDYRQSSAGIRVLHYLCHALNELGEEAYLANARVVGPGLRTPQLSKEVMLRHYAEGRTPVALYPEVVTGNPLDVPIVARWLLNKPGHLGGDTSFDPSDLIFHFGDWCLLEGMQGHHLQLPAIDPYIFNNRENPWDHQRKGSCYYANKFLVFGGQVDPRIKNSSVSLGLDSPRSHEELADILRKSEVMYCYEPSTLVYEALACGCPVLIVPSDYWAQNGAPEVLNSPGVALASDVNALQKAKVSLAKYDQEELLYESTQAAWWQVENFVSIASRAAAQYNAKRLTDTSDLDQAQLFALWSLPPRQRKNHKQHFEARLDTLTALAPSSSLSVPAASDVTKDAIGPAELTLYSERTTKWASAPVFHIVVTQDESDTGTALAQTLQSLQSQHYSQVIATVISRHSAPPNLGQGRLEWLCSSDDHRLVANEAIKTSPAAWCGLLRAGDQVPQEAFLRIAEFINSHPACNALYTDEAVIEADGQLVRHHLKPDFDEDLLLSAGYVGGLLLAKKETWINAGGWRALPRGLDEFDAAIRIAATSGTSLGHVEGVLYYRHHADPTLRATDAESDQQRLALAQELLGIIMPQTSVELGLAPGLIHVRHPLAQIPGVSIVIPTRDNVERLDQLISSILAKTEYADYELVIVDNDSQDEKTQAYLAGLNQIDPSKIRVIQHKGAFNLAALLNQGATHAVKDLLLFLHDDVTAIHQDWLANLVVHIQRAGIKAVGARLVSADTASIVEAGISPYQAGILGRPFQGWPIDNPAPMGRVHAIQRVSAISAACMLVSKADFLSLGGMDAEHFPEKFADIDFCLKLREAGGNIVWTPYATLIHDTDNTTWGDKSDNNALLAKWGKALVQDPRHNPYIALGSDTFVPEAEPAFMPDPITWHPLPNVYSMSSDQDGAGHYRVIQPVQHATEQGLIRGRYGLGYPVPVMMEKLDIDVVFSQRQLEDRQLDNLTRFKKLLRCKIVMDFDDLLTNVPDKNVHKRTLLKDMKGRLRRVGELADRFTVSTEPLAREFKQFHDDIRVVPNALLRSQWAHLTSQRGTSRKLRVGWAGGVSHQGDLEVIRDVVRDLADEVDWVFMGMCLKELNPHIKEFHAGAQFNAYPAELAKLNLDLAIAPLELNAFNECKSHLRVLEYGVLGIPVIATNITPYQGGFPITLVKNKHQDWMKAIREHINDPDETYKRGDALRQHILDNWMLDQHLETWRAAWDV